MQLLILAAGKGTRMGELTKNTPKPMLPIKGMPILEHKIKMLPDDITEVILLVGYQSDKIKNHFGDEFAGKKITYVFHDIINGTGGATHAVKDHLEDKFMVMMGDDLYHREDIEKMIKHDMAVLAHEVEDPRQFGVLKVGKDGEFLDIIEKPENPEFNLVNTGLYTLNKKFFDYDLVPISETEYGLPQTLLKMAGDHFIKVEKAKLWHPVGNPEELKRAEEIIHLFL